MDMTISSCCISTAFDLLSYSYLIVSNGVFVTDVAVCIIISTDIVNFHSSARSAKAGTNYFCVN